MKICAFEDQKELAKKISDHLDCPFSLVPVIQFADGEQRVQLNHPEEYTQETVVIVQSTCKPQHDHLMQIMFLAHELKNAEAAHVIAAIPYFGYSRQEKSNVAGKPGQAAAVAGMLQSSGIDQVLTIQIHDPVIEQFFSIPFHDLRMVDLIAQHINQQFGVLRNEVCLVAPDEGAEPFVMNLAHLLGMGMLTYQKERFGVDQTRIVGRTGTCLGKTALIIDDMIATGGTAINVAAQLISNGFPHVYGYFVHPVLSGNVFERLATSPFTEIFVCNTIPVHKEPGLVRISVLDVSESLAQALEEIG